MVVQLALAASVSAPRVVQTMTAIKATTPSVSSGEDHGRDSSAPVVVAPSATEDEAKTRYAVALEKGVTTLLERGYGRERVSNELMNEIANGCAPDEEEVSVSRGWMGMGIIFEMNDLP